MNLVFDLDDCHRRPLPLAEDSVDEFPASHVIEHLRQPLPFMQELHRVAKPGARAVKPIREPKAELQSSYKINIQLA